LNWIFHQPTRAEKERDDIAELQESSPWLSGAVARLIPGLKLAVDFTLAIGEDQLEFTLHYPDFFPDVPPSVIPKDPGRISGHQWGAGGELCLEYRADNWAPEYTGAMMIGSSYRLLSGEAGDDKPPVPSAHNMSVGQEVRGSISRLLLTGSTKQHLLGLAPQEPVDFTFNDHWYAQTWFAQITSLALDGDTFWSETPPYVEEIPTKRTGKAMRLRSDQKIPQSLTREKLQELMTGSPLEAWVRDQSPDVALSIILLTGVTIRLFSFFSDATAIKFETVDIPPAGERLPPSHAALAEKRVAIVGCGSVGSKVAVSLARAGVKLFELVDADLFYPGNIVRNELDLRAVGANKAKAVKREIIAVRPDADVTTKNIALGGQEASDLTSGALKDLGKCDLIVDATADPTVFNLCGLVSRNEKKPMAWAQVYAGGVGGLIARARPEIDPPPMFARAQIQNWYAAQNVPWLAEEGTDYDALPADQPPLVADDADVSVVAAHLTRLVIDTLTRGQTSIFPASAYCIGLAESWLFAAPFDTWPITYASEGTWGPTVEADAVERALAFMTGLFPKEEESEVAADAG
jgi:hypothetical protein